MFRQTLIRGCQNRNLEAGATNDKHDKDRVLFTLSGDEIKINEIVNFLGSSKDLNSWGAKVTDLKEIKSDDSSSMEIQDHQVHTSNVDGFNWNKNVTMYL
jgi:hypothetical protein